MMPLRVNEINKPSWVLTIDQTFSILGNEISISIVPSVLASQIMALGDLMI